MTDAERAEELAGSEDRHQGCASNYSSRPVEDSCNCQWGIRVSAIARALGEVREEGKREGAESWTYRAALAGANCEGFKEGLAPPLRALIGGAEIACK
jgi:hypothetical protein